MTVLREGWGWGVIIIIVAACLLAVYAALWWSVLLHVNFQAGTQDINYGNAMILGKKQSLMTSQRLHTQTSHTVLLSEIQSSNLGA